MIEWDELNNEEKTACLSLFKREAISEKDDLFRLGAIATLGLNASHKKDKCPEIRICAYIATNSLKEGLLDKDDDVRLAIKDIIGYAEKDKLDKCEDIRLKAFLRYGFTPESLNDECDEIRRLANIFFVIKNNKNKNISLLDVKRKHNDIFKVEEEEEKATPTKWQRIKNVLLDLYGKMYYNFKKRRK